MNKLPKKGVATDGHRYTRIENEKFIRVHPCESVALIVFKDYMTVGRMASVIKVVRPAALLLRMKYTTP